MPRILILGLALAASVAVGERKEASGAAKVARRCTLMPGAVRAVIHVQRDTTVRFPGNNQQALMHSGSSAFAFDSLLATSETPMPSARVRVLRLDSATRAVLASSGITDPQPSAYIMAAPYGPDCRTIRWTDTASWTRAGDTGYVVATLASRDRWIRGAPVFVIADAWNYPYPRNVGLTGYPPALPPYASPDALFSFEDRVSRARDSRFRDSASADSLLARAIVWAREHGVQREREPIRSRLSTLFSVSNFERIESRLSRLRGTYRVQLRVGNTSATWLFRTVDRPAYRWYERDALRAIGEWIDSPFGAGYRLVGYAADSAGTLPASAPRSSATRALQLVWLAAADRPLAPGNDTTSALTAMLEFQRQSAPVGIWDALDPYVPAPSARDSLFLTRLPRRARGSDQPRFPLTLRIGRDGSVGADTTMVRGGRSLRITLSRLDSVAVARPF